MARKAGTHKIASPIGDGSQTKILFFVSFILLEFRLSEKYYQTTQIPNPKSQTVAAFRLV
jgi:hypothetical protein